jgi:hypothetical protein
MTSLPPHRLKEHADARRKIVMRKGAKLWPLGAGGRLTRCRSAANLRCAVGLCTGATMSGSDDDEIAKYLAQKGATKCPPRAARELGETSPGWRRNVERKAEHAQGGKTHKRQQRALRERGGFGDQGEEKG